MQPEEVRNACHNDNPQSENTATPFCNNNHCPSENGAMEEQ